MSDIQTFGYGAMPYAEACELFNVGTVVRRFGTYVVTDWGIASLVTKYEIDASILRGDTDWPAHMSRKRWSDCADFNAAYAFALEYHCHGRAAA